MSSDDIQIPSENRDVSHSNPSSIQPTSDETQGTITTSNDLPLSAPNADYRISIPSHLATYALEGVFLFYSDQEALCTRASSRLETVDLLRSAFPQLRNRSANSVKFEVFSPQRSWVAVTDAIWRDIMVDVRPRRIRVSIIAGLAESIMQWTAMLLVFTSPIWLWLGIVLGPKETFSLAMQTLGLIFLSTSTVVVTLWVTDSL